MRKMLKEMLDSAYVGNGEENRRRTMGDDYGDEEEETVGGGEKEEEMVDGRLCVECKDAAAERLCGDCQEQFCVVCFSMIHRTGRRRKHLYMELTNEIEQEQENGEEEESLPRELPAVVMDADEKMLRVLLEHSKYVPLRLKHEERHLFRLLEAALRVSEYTDRVDILSSKSRARRIVEQLKEICSVLCGLVMASDLKAGQKLAEMKEFGDNAAWFQDVFEIGRRYKIMNPERMRDTFGKLCYMVMDSRLPQIEEQLEFHLYKPIKTVQSYLSDPRDNGKALSMFEDKLLLYATSNIDPKGKSRAEINRLVRQKELSVEELVSKYCTSVFSREDIRQVLYSIGDYNAYINANRKPIVSMLKRLDRFCEPEIISKYPISIQQGKNGARLTHDHERQWHYVQQSLMLWSVIQRKMIQLWYIADKDLFDGSSYKLVSTGQGLNRVKPCPALYEEMYNILSECRAKCGGWVGSSVVHLGDDAVPNALFFLDKYTQVPNILIPFEQTLSNIDDLAAADPALKNYIDQKYGSIEDLKLTILQDAFAHMFDGSGADNFYMSGSCIDGRLTSAWNHTNNISRKVYFNIFLMNGFTGFNGSEGF
ncbi:uncharacterized protein Ecym_6386 [Eremothecium cymbalariae DBVPG|uniref:B box-type domain-containing protein n=1 Tax=Eremothecium cymbalariae (strain CBS 270.75 / DBVPG 7215 / KCTC 17166 / NRRL Y-17582) TaxID=931890 RepID=G8JUI1_ERECY|nr:hypothetical protein Ecym_6386 [Eremothecium cymbalariae DBVPG\